ncbi:MAG: phosphopantothenoylcysteine decarboxylase [Methylacidiphilales bacterium]|nr:phosphopantothenoylcysteine decarboxylase [Candidatus Methylacidiphilales bacterium]
MAHSAPILITAGPAYEPIDNVRRLTNFSTGTLGCTLATLLTSKGFDVTLALSEAATCKANTAAARVLNFTTNDSLSELLHDLGSNQSWHGVLHTAALADFRVDEVLDDRNQPLKKRKIPSSTSELKIILKPAAKIIRQLRPIFPDAKIAGWKYELEGTRQTALQKGWGQIEDCKTDACVVNGLAYGDGYAFCAGRNQSVHLNDLEALADHLSRWLGE